MNKIKEFFSDIKNTNNKEGYTIDEVCLDSIKKINKIKQEIETVGELSPADYAKFFIEIDDKLKDVKSKIFHKCCRVEGMKESKNALCLYRDFLVEYNKVLYVYNISIKEKMRGDIGEITDEIIAIKKQLLPINNSNVELHSKHHLHNKEYNTKIENLEEKRINLLKNDQIKKDNKK